MAKRKRDPKMKVPKLKWQHRNDDVKSKKKK